MKALARCIYALCSLALLVGPQFAHAQADGKDFWVGEAERRGLYIPHGNNCDSGTEAFIVVGSNANEGFCFEKSERAADTLESAKQTCGALGKRLPEPTEWKYACKNGAGLSNMTDDWEWASNTAALIWGNSGASLLMAVVMGNGACTAAAWGYLGEYYATEGSYVFRCVR